jgi:two-component system, NtrC family, nitrogen regulation sensor histidine kinase NtrY
MSFRVRLSFAFAVVASCAVLVIAAITFSLAMRNFRQNDAQIADALLGQVRRDLERTGEELQRVAGEVATSDAIQRVVADPDPFTHVDDAADLARVRGLEFLELLRPDGTVISSAHWPARYGYKSAVPLGRDGAFVGHIETASGEQLVMLAEHRSPSIIVVTGSSIPHNLARLKLPSDVWLWIFEPQNRSVSTIGAQPASGVPLAEVVEKRIADHTTAFADANFSYSVLPLSPLNEPQTAYVIVGRSIEPRLQFQRGLVVSALVSLLVAILVGAVLGSVVAKRITEPVEELAQAAAKVADGDLQQRVEVRSSDEIGQLGASFNRMTSDLVSQRDKLVQAERVAAWRELARRLAHELKNPLFPLQLTIETMEKARQMNSPDLQEIVRDGTRTLHEEFMQLKNVIARFSDFSKMPAPELQNVDVNAVAQSAVQLQHPVLQAKGIRSAINLDPAPLFASADPVLLRRAIDNLILNAIDAMPNGGTLNVRTSRSDERAVIEVADLGSGLTPEECERLFTPYYTTKQHGTGLGLAIVQSIVSDHGGQISVRSEKGSGTTFRMEFPLASARATQV